MNTNPHSSIPLLRNFFFAFRMVRFSNPYQSYAWRIYYGQSMRHPPKRGQKHKIIDEATSLDRN